MAGIKIEKSLNLSKLPPYLFAEIDRKVSALRKEGRDIISFGVGDPDIPTSAEIVEKMKENVANPAYHRYPFGRGLEKFREAAGKWYSERFGVSLDPENEIHALIGSKEGIGHLPLGLVNPGDVVLVPEPGYPVYAGGTILAGGEVYYMRLLEKNSFLPDLDGIPSGVAKRAKLMFINYPNNPTAAMADAGFYRKVVDFARKYNVVVASDNAYSEIFYGKEPMSFLEVEGAKDVGIEFHSLSKTFNMTGWRIGFAVGAKEVIKLLAEVKDNYDSGVFSAVQATGVYALQNYRKFTEENIKIWRKRRNLLYEGLRTLGFKGLSPEATFYIWVKNPAGLSSAEVCEILLDKALIVATPGSGFGPSGEGFTRFAFTVDEERIKEALARMKKVKW